MNKYYGVLLQVVLEEINGGMQRQVPLVIQGLAANGYLRAIDEGGEEYELHPDGNRSVQRRCRFKSHTHLCQHAVGLGTPESMDAAYHIGCAIL